MRLLILPLILALVPQANAENLCEVAIAKAHLGESETGSWSLQWNDEFEVDGRPDPKLWKYEIGGTGWGNKEDQFYTDRPENSRVENGKLVIEARKEDYQNKHYTSARINSVSQITYGKVEFRAKMAVGQGTWGAAWLLAAKQVYGPAYWPDNGEIDVMESVGHKPNINHVSLHSHNNSFFNGTQISAQKFIANANQEFHNYSIEWLPESITLLVDDMPLLHVTRKPGDDWQQWPFDQDMFLIMNLAVGGTWGKEGGPTDDSLMPARLEFEYVRVYRPSTSNPDCYIPDRVP